MNLDEGEHLREAEHLDVVRLNEGEHLHVTDSESGRLDEAR